MCVHACVVSMWTTGVGTQVLHTVCLKDCSIGQASWISSNQGFAYFCPSAYYHWHRHQLFMWVSGVQNEIMTFARRVLYQLSHLLAYCCFLLASPNIPE